MKKNNKIKQFYFYNKKVNVLKSLLKKIIFRTGSFLFNKKEISGFEIKNIKKILLISLHYRGDLLFCTPSFEILKNIFPDSLIDVWCKSRSSEVLENNDNINEVLIFDDVITSEYEVKKGLNIFGKLTFLKKLQRKKYDLIIDCTGLYKTALFSLFARPKYLIGRNSQGFNFIYNKCFKEDFFTTPGNLIEKYSNIIKDGLSITDNDWNNIINDITLKTRIYFNDKNTENIVNELNKRKFNPDKYLICIHLTAGWEAKRWDIKNFIYLIKRLINDLNYEVAIIGNDFDRIEYNKIMNLLEIEIPQVNLNNLFFQLSLLDNAALINKSSVFIGSDSIPLHIAGALDIPSIGLFGPTNPDFSNPIGDKHISIYKKLSCSAKFDHQYCSRNAGKSCSTLDCMKLITVDEVIDKINILINLYKK